MSKVSRAGPGRPKGALNKITRDIRAVLRDLAEGNAHRVQEWLDRVAVTDPAEAVRLWVALLRFVTPTLQAASIAEVTRSTSVQAQLYAMTDAELDLAIIQSAPIPPPRESAPALPKPDPDDEDLLR